MANPFRTVQCPLHPTQSWIFVTTIGRASPSEMGNEVLIPLRPNHSLHRQSHSHLLVHLEFRYGHEDIRVKYSLRYMVPMLSAGMLRHGFLTVVVRTNHAIDISLSKPRKCTL
jgi:hypothetical protein